MSKQQPFSREAIRDAVTKINADPTQAQTEIDYLTQAQPQAIPTSFQPRDCYHSSCIIGPLTYLITQSAPSSEVATCLNVLRLEQFASHRGEIIGEAISYALQNNHAIIIELLNGLLLCTQEQQYQQLSREYRTTPTRIQPILIGLLQHEIITQDNILEILLKLVANNPRLAHVCSSAQQPQEWRGGSFMDMHQIHKIDTRNEQVTTRITQLLDAIDRNPMSADADNPPSPTALIAQLTLLTYIAPTHANKYIGISGHLMDKKRLGSTVIAWTDCPPSDRLRYFKTLYKKALPITSGKPNYLLAATIRQEQKARETASHSGAGYRGNHKPEYAVYVTTAQLIHLITELVQLDFDRSTQAAKVFCTDVDFSQPDMQIIIKTQLQKQLDCITTIKPSTRYDILLTRINRLRFLCELYLTDARNNKQVTSFLCRLIDSLQTNPHLPATNKQKALLQVVTLSEAFGLSSVRTTASQLKSAIRLVNWEVQTEAVCGIIGNKDIDIKVLRDELVKIRASHQTGETSKAELDQLLHACIQRIRQTHGIESELATQIENEFRGVLSLAQVGDIGTSLALFDSTHSLHHATHGVRFPQRLAAIPASFQAITDKGEALLEAITSSDFTPMQKQALLVDLLYFSHQHRLQLTLTAIIAEPLKWLAALPALTYYFGEREKRVELLTKGIQQVIRDLNGLSDFDRKLFTQLLLLAKSFRIQPAALIIEQVQQLRDKDGAFTSTDEANIVSLLELLTVSRRNECLTLHSAIAKSHNTNFIRQLCELGLNAKLQDAGGFFPHERTEDQALKSLLQNALADRPLIPEAELVAFDKKTDDPGTLEVVTVVSGGGGAKDSQAADTDPATLKTTEGKLTLDGQVTLIANNLLKQKPFWHGWGGGVKVSLIQACGHLFKREMSSPRLGAAARLFFLIHACQDGREYHTLEEKVLSQHGLPVRISEENLQHLFACRARQPAARPPATNPAAAGGGGAAAN
jgi:hypothetical protein